MPLLEFITDFLRSHRAAAVECALSAGLVTVSQLIDEMHTRPIAEQLQTAHGIAEYQLRDMHRARAAAVGE